MSFRFVFTVLFSVSVALGCAGENASLPPPAIHFDSSKYQCLSEADATLQKFIEARLTESELGAFWNCIDSAVVKFVKFVRGSDGQNYTPQQLAKFLDDFFLKGRGLSEQKELIAEMMELKRLFLGGSLDKISHQDLFYRTRDLIQSLKAITLHINPHMKVLHGIINDQDGELQADEVMAATEALKFTGSELAQLMKKGRYFYSFTHLQALFTQLEIFIQKRDPNFKFEAKKFVPLLAEAKGLLVSPPYDLIRNEDWTRLFDSISNVVSWGVQYKYYIEKQDWGRGRPFEMLSQLATGVLHEIDLGLARQENNEFSFVDLDRIIGRLADLGMLPLDLDAATGRDVLRRVADRVLDPTGKPSTGLNRGDFDALRMEVSRWIQAQQYINQVAVADIDLTAPEILDAGTEMRLLMRTRWPLLTDSKSRLVFSPGAFKGKWDQKSLTTLNWQRGLMRALMRGYATQTSPDGAVGLTSDQLGALVQDWHVLAEKLELFAPGAGDKMAKKIFMEANLFMPSSNGDERIDFIEAVQYLGFATSGIHSADEMIAAFGKSCSDPKAPKKFLATCVRNQLFEKRLRLLDNFPLMLDFISDNRSRWHSFETMLESTTRDGISDDSFSHGDLIEIVVLLHYLETFFATYDAGMSQFISVDETLNAFPVFYLSLKEIVKTGFGMNMTDDDLKALFTYLFKYGAPPQTDMGGAVKFLNWRLTPHKWQYEVDRHRVIQILAELNSRR